MKRIAALLLSVLVCAAARAQTTTITASHIQQDVSGTLLATGYFVLTPVNAFNQPTGFASGAGGQVLPRASYWPITNGAISGVVVPDTSETVPAHIGYQVVVTDGNKIPIYTFAQPIYPTGTSWSFDSWSPSVTVQVSPPTAVSSGTQAPTGSCTAPSLFYYSTNIYMCVGSSWALLTGAGTNATSIQSVPVSATAPTNGQALVYNSGSSSYVPSSVAGSGITSLTGDVSASGSGAAVATVTGINGVSLAGLSTGLLRNTTSTGAPSIAVAGTDYATPSELASTIGSTVHEWLNSYNAGTHTFLQSQPAFSDLSGTAASSQLPLGTSSAPGALECGSGTSCSGGVITATGSGGGNTTASTLTAGALPLATGANAIGNSLFADNGTTGSYAGTGGFSAPSFIGSGTVPSALDLPAGTGSIPTLPASSAGFAGPDSGGTSYVFKLPATAVAGILHAAAPATGDGVNESALTSSAIALASADVSGILPVANGGTGTASPALVAGANVTITGSWPDQTIAASGGGSLSSGTLGQMLYYAATGTTVTPTSAITVAGASSGSAVGIGQASPVATLDLTGTYRLIGSGPTAATTVSATCSATATSCSVVSTAGYPSSGILVVDNVYAAVEVVSYTGITSTSFTGLSRGLYSSTAASWNSGTDVYLVSELRAVSAASAPYFMAMFDGPAFYSLTSGLTTVANFGPLQPGGSQALVFGFGSQNTKAYAFTDGSYIESGSGSNGGDVEVGNYTNGSGLVVDGLGIPAARTTTLAVTAGTTTIAPQSGTVYLTGTTVTGLTTITVPASSACLSSGVTCAVTLIGGGIGLTTATGGNIADAVTIAANGVGECWYLQSTSLWYCK